MIVKFSPFNGQKNAVLSYATKFSRPQNILFINFKFFVEFSSYERTFSRIYVCVLLPVKILRFGISQIIVIVIQTSTFLHAQTYVRKTNMCVWVYKINIFFADYILTTTVIIQRMNATKWE
jgi:hypothetical protein